VSREQTAARKSLPGSESQRFRLVSKLRTWHWRTCSNTTEKTYSSSSPREGKVGARHTAGVHGRADERGHDTEKRWLRIGTGTHLRQTYFTDVLSLGATTRRDGPPRASRSFRWTPSCVLRSSIAAVLQLRRVTDRPRARALSALIFRPEAAAVQTLAFASRSQVSIFRVVVAFAIRGRTVVRVGGSMSASACVRGVHTGPRTREEHTRGPIAQVCDMASRPTTRRRRYTSMVPDSHTDGSHGWGRRGNVHPVRHRPGVRIDERRRRRCPHPASSGIHASRRGGRHGATYGQVS
jgi:hypothetical protein